MWMIMDRYEQYVRTSPRYIDDLQLTAEVKRIVCELRTDLCDAVRVHLIRVPGFNASMAPNGAMFVQSGLLLRIENDSQLAAVLGHELSHFDRRHSIENWRKHRRASTGFAVFGAILGAASAVAVGGATDYQSVQRSLDLSNTAYLMLETAQIFTIFQLLAFSREQESEADLDGVNWMAGTAYSPTETVTLWKNLAEEEAAAGDQAGFSLLSTHPTPAKRIAELSRVAAAAKSAVVDEPTKVASMVGEYRLDWLEDELQALTPEQFAHVAERQAWFGVLPGAIDYYQGTAWLKHAKSTGLTPREVSYAYAEAIKAFEAGHAAKTGFPPEGLSDLARCYLQTQNRGKAKWAFEAYLEAVPDAWDAKFVRRQLEAL